MKKNLLKHLAMLVLVISLVVLGLSMTSCKDKITDIYIANTTSPRTLYVEGQDLDLTSGYLTVVMKSGEEAKLAFSSEEVTVSGYNKNQIGEQTVTVSYGELSTTFTVTVIPRMVAEGYETLYFVGDAFDKEKGRLKIAADDGTTFHVNMNDSRVKVDSFDSTKTGVVVVRVSYVDVTTTYTTSFNVTVYEHENVTFTPPPQKNNSYMSHDKNGVNVSGGYFTIVSSDGKLTKKVNLTKEMVQGFDLTVATIANRTSPYVQTLTVEYLPGITFTYPIEITYSPVSVVNYYAEGVLAGIEWNNAGALATNLTEEQITAALDAVDSFYKLTVAEKKLVSAENTQTIVRAGAVASQKAFSDQLDTFSGTFAIDEAFNIYLTAEKFATVASDIVRLKDKNEKINLYAKYLQNLEADFADTVIVTGTTVGDHIRVYTKEMYDIIVDIIDHMVSVYEGMADFPVNWTKESLEQYGDSILGATLQINSAGYYEEGTGGFYTQVLSKWREKDDFFEILYAYFLYVYEDGVTFISNNMLGSVPLPGALDAWHESLSQAVIYIEYYIEYYNAYLRTQDKKYLQEIILDDVSVMMFHFFKTVELAQEVKKSNNTLHIDLYRAIEGDSINHLYMVNRDFGYLYQVGGLDDSKAFGDLWNVYYEILKHYDKNTLSSQEHADELKLLFASFSELSPTELFGFLNTINFLYAKTDFSVNVLSYTDTTSYSTFVKILKEHYLPYLNDSNKPLFQKLLLAMENYALVGHKENALSEFVLVMREVVNAYNNSLSAEDRENFNTYLGIAYEKYLDLYLLASEEVTPTLTSKENALLQDLLASLERYYKLHSYISSLTDKPDKLLGVLYATFVEADALYNEFMDVASDDGKAYFFFKTYDVAGKNQTLAVALYQVDETTTAMLNLRSFELTSQDNYKYRVTAWELLKEYDMMPLLADIASLLYYGMEGYTVNAPTVDEIVAMMDSVRNLVGIQNSIFTILYVSEGYYEALLSFFGDTLTEGAFALAQKLIEAEKAYRAGDTATFNATMQALVPAWEAYTNSEEKGILASMYNYYKSLMA